MFRRTQTKTSPRSYPASERSSRINGVAEKKLQEFDKILLAEIASYLRIHPREVFAEGSFAVPAPAKPFITRNALGELQVGRKRQELLVFS